MNNTLNTLFMAFAKGNVSVEAGESTYKKYVGVSNVRVLCVNPTKNEIKKYTGYEPKEEPVYTGVQQVDGKDVPYARVTFLLQTVAEKNGGIDTTYQLNYFIRNQYRKSTNSGTFQVIDNYTNTAWADEATIKAGAPITYNKKDGSGTVEASIIGKYRPVYVGEVALTNFIKEYLNIGKMPTVGVNKNTNAREIREDNGYEWINGTRVPMSNDKLAECECTFTADEIQAMFKGDFSAVKNAIELQPKNEVKAVFGIRTNEDREYQEVYSRVIRTRSSNVDVIQVDIENAKNNGGLNGREYSFEPIHEYVVTPSDVSANTANPFDAAVAADPWA